MKKKYMLLIISSILLYQCSTGPSGKHYGLNNPLRFYDGGFTLQNVFEAQYQYRDPFISKPIYLNQGYIERSGFLSNTNFISLVGKSNLAHIFLNGSVWQTNVISNIIISNGYYLSEYFIHANEKYFVTAGTNFYFIRVYLILNKQLIFEETVFPVFNLSAILGNGKSDLLAYQYNQTNIRLLNLSNTNVIYLGQGFCPNAFSQKNKYFFYSDFGKKDKYYFWNHYTYEYRKDIGQPFIYDIQNNTNYSIATYQCLDTGVGFNRGEYGTTFAVGLHDGFYAIDYSLTNLYIYICNPDYGFVYDRNLYDGTYAPDAEGLYRIDISSLGLSE